MTRTLVLLAAALLLAYLVAQGVARLRAKLAHLLDVEAAADRLHGRRASPRHGGELVACAACGLRVARTRAIEVAGGRVFCSEACRRRPAAA